MHELIIDRTVLLMAEDERKLNSIVRPLTEGTGDWMPWSDDFDAQIRRLSAGDRDGYYQDVSGSVKDLATI